MRVYHGSTIEIRTPDVSFSNKYVDFGKGFYVTTYAGQAEKWALRKAMRNGKNAVVNVYEFDSCRLDLSIRKFESEDPEWLDFVCSCRRGIDVSSEDIIIGAVANDDVFKTVDMYFRGIWTRERALEELRYYKTSDQIVFKNNSAIEKVLRFRESYEVKTNDRQA